MRIPADAAWWEIARLESCLRLFGVLASEVIAPVHLRWREFSAVAHPYTPTWRPMAAVERDATRSRQLMETGMRHTGGLQHRRAGMASRSAWCNPREGSNQAFVEKSVTELESTWPSHTVYRTSRITEADGFGNESVPHSMALTNVSHSLGLSTPRCRRTASLISCAAS